MRNTKLEKGNTNTIEMAFTDVSGEPISPSKVEVSIYSSKKILVDGPIDISNNKTPESIGKYYYYLVPEEIGSYYIEFKGTVAGLPIIKREKYTVAFGVSR